MEDTKMHNKSVWILLQNLSKAYDHVDLNILKKAIAYLQILLNYINLIIDFFSYYKNVILITDSLSDYYDVKINID